MTSLRRHFDRLDAWLVATSVIAAMVIALVHCNDDAVCGNGVQEDKEQCDKGALNGVENSGCSSTCTIAALNVAGLQLLVTKLKDEAMGFPGVGCSELGATMQHVVITGPTNIDMTVDCGMSPAYLNHDITPGDYSATVTLLDGSGNPLTKTVSAGTVSATKGQTAMLTANFAQADFLKQDYTGTLFFAPSWGAASTKCDAATPAVTGYGITLKDKNGKLVAGMSTASRKLDGTSGPCFDPGPTGTAEAVAGLTWGHYGITFTGYAGATLAYCKTFDVFSGPGTANATYALTVTGADPDAGVSCP